MDFEENVTLPKIYHAPEDYCPKLRFPIVASFVKKKNRKKKICQTVFELINFNLLLEFSQR